MAIPPAPPAQARILMQCLELLIDTLIDTTTALAYPASCGLEPQPDLDFDFDDEMPF